MIVGVLIVARFGALAARRPVLRRRKAPPRPVAEDFAPCPRCGAWIARGAPCDCGTP